MELAHCAILLKEVETAMEKYLNNAMHSLDLTMSQARTLSILLEYPDKRASLKELEKRLALAQPVTAGIIKRLENHRYVESFGDAADKRVKLVRITPIGEKKCMEAQKLMLDMENTFFGKLTDKERCQLSSLLTKVKASD